MTYINNVFSNAINEISYWDKFLFDIRKKPDLILSDMFINGEDCLLTYLFKNNIKLGDIDNKLNIFAFQKYLYDNLIMYLKTNFSEYKFYYEEESYPSLLIIKKEKDLAGIDIYNHICYIYENEEVVSKKEELNKLSIKQKELEKEAEYYASSIQDVFKLANNSFDYLKIALKSKKYKNKAIKQYKDINEEILNIEIKRGKIENELENIKRKELPIDICKKKIAKFFKNKYNYNLILPNEFVL